MITPASTVIVGHTDTAYSPALVVSPVASATALAAAACGLAKALIPEVITEAPASTVMTPMT